MTDISFYHLQRQPLTQALPKLLERVLSSGMQAVILCGSTERVAALDAILWTYDPDSFLPHGTLATGFADKQPVYLTTEEENPNDASVLVLVDGGAPAFVKDFTRCLDMFDGNDAQAVEDARIRWKHYKEGGHSLKYWQQTSQGGWENKA